MANTKSKIKPKYEKIIINNESEELSFMKSNMEKFTEKYKQCSSQHSDVCKKRKGMWLKSDYYKSSHDEFDGYFPICKECFYELVNNETTGELSRRGLAKTLPIFNIPYLQKLYEGSIKAKGASAGTYIRSIQLNEDDKRFLDSDSDVLNMAIEVDNGYDIDDIVIDDELYLKWGSYHEKQDIISLEYNYNKYIQSYQIEGMIEENSIKDICFLELEKSKARANGRATDKIQKQWADIIGMLKLKPDQQTKTSQKYTKLGNIAELIEQGEPIVEEDPSFTDVDGMTWYIENFFSQIFKVFGKSKISKEKPKKSGE